MTKLSPESVTEGLQYSSNVYKDKDNADISVFSFDLNFNLKNNTETDNPEGAVKKSKFSVSQNLLISDDYSKDLSFPPYLLKIKVKKV